MPGNGDVAVVGGKDVERALNGNAASAGSIQSAAHAAAKAIDPLDDAANGADYRRGLVRTVVRRALERAAA